MALHHGFRLAKEKILDYRLILFQVCLIKDILKQLIRVVQQLNRLWHGDLRLLLDSVEVLVNRVQQTPDELVGVVLHSALEHVVDLADCALQLVGAEDVFFPPVFADLGLVPHGVEEFGVHYSHLSMVRPIFVLRIELILEDQMIEEVSSERPTVAQALDGTVHVAGVAIVFEANQASLCTLLRFQHQF